MRLRLRFPTLAITLAFVVVLSISACQSESPERARLKPLTCQTLADGREVKKFELGGSYWQVPCEAYVIYFDSDLYGSSASLQPVITRSGQVEWSSVWDYAEGDASPIRVTMRFASSSNPMSIFSRISRATRLNTEFADLDTSVRSSPQQFGSRFYWIEGTRNEAIIGLPLEHDHHMQSRWIRCTAGYQPGYSMAPWTDWLNMCSAGLRLTPHVIVGIGFHSSQLPLVDELITNLHALLVKAETATPSQGPWK